MRADLSSQELLGERRGAGVGGNTEALVQRDPPDHAAGFGRCLIVECVGRGVTTRIAVGLSHYGR